MSTETKLQELADAVDETLLVLDNIKNAIIEKGIDIPDGTPTSEYADKIAKLPRIFETIDWAEVQSIVQSGNAATEFPIGTQFKVQHSVHGEHLYDVVAHDYLKKSDDESAHTMTLLCHDALNSYQFDAREAFYYADQELAAGTYNFTIATTISSWAAGTYQFTLTQALPAGGQLGLSGYYSTALTSLTVKSYESPKATTAIESVVITAGSEGTSLGTFGVELNHAHRVSYGSNNYKESAIRQMLNSDANAGFWEPQTKFDRVPSWNSSVPGFAQGFDDAFAAIVCEVVLPCSANAIYESPDSTVTVNTAYTLNDKYYLASRCEIYGDHEVIDGSKQFPYYRSTDAVDKIKYRNEAAAYWWLRSSYQWSAISVRIVNTDGSLYSNSALVGYALVPACTIA